MACDEVHVTDTAVGESLCRFAVAAGDLLIADRGFATRKGVRHVHQHGGAVIVRLNLTNLPLTDGQGQPFAWLPHLRTLDAGRVGDWPVAVREDKKGLPPITGRVCAIKKSKTAAERSRARAERESRRSGHQVQPETLEAAEYIFVFTTLGAHVPAPAILEMYRGRWQVELTFKRLKSLLDLGILFQNIGDRKQSLHYLRLYLDRAPRGQSTPQIAEVRQVVREMEDEERKSGARQ